MKRFKALPPPRRIRPKHKGRAGASACASHLDRANTTGVSPSRAASIISTTFSSSPPSPPTASTFGATMRRRTCSKYVFPSSRDKVAATTAAPAMYWKWGRCCLTCYCATSNMLGIYDARKPQCTSQGRDADRTHAAADLGRG